ncbi:MAG TPA: hydrogenase subunit MbhD domain-containing protein [Candidatus Limnocylindria bacterium]|nr:hydrogenase subunit MbhD domain-containing protein [Candidatus Limnocylindria bacterium]
MTFAHVALLSMLIVCALAVALSRNLLVALIVYMAYSLMMAIIWMLMESPDLAITEAAVGAGITGVLFFITLKKIHAIKGDEGRGEAQK